MTIHGDRSGQTKSDKRVGARAFQIMGLCAFLLLAVLAGAVLAGSPSVRGHAQGAAEPMDAPGLQGTVSVSISPATRYVYVNGHSSIDVYVTAGSNQVQAADILVSFDPTYIRVNSLSVGSALPVVVKRDYSNSTGRIDYSAYIVGNTATGTFRAFSINFQAIALTSGSAVSFRPDTLIVGPAGEQHTASLHGGRVVVMSVPTPTNTLTPSVTPVPSTTPLPTMTYTPVPGKVCVAVHEELHGNHVRDDDEALLSGAVVAVSNMQATPVATYITDGVSEPHCFDLTPGLSYIVSVEESPEGYTSYGAGAAYVSLEQGEQWDVNFGQVLAPTATPTLTPSNTPTPTRGWQLTPTPDTVSVVITPEVGGGIDSPDGKIGLVIPPDAVTDPVTVTFDYGDEAYGPVSVAQGAAPGCLIGVGRAFTLSATYVDDEAPVEFQQPVTLTACYSGSDVAVEGTVALYRWDPSLAAWVEVPSEPEPGMSCLNAELDSLGRFTLGIEGRCMWLPLIWPVVIDAPFTPQDAGPPAASPVAAGPTRVRRPSLP